MVRNLAVMMSMVVVYGGCNSGFPRSVHEKLRGVVLDGEREVYGWWWQCVLVIRIWWVVAVTDLVWPVGLLGCEWWWQWVVVVIGCLRGRGRKRGSGRERKRWWVILVVAVCGATVVWWWLLGWDFDCRGGWWPL